MIAPRSTLAPDVVFCGGESWSLLPAAEVDRVGKPSNTVWN
jgi:hypothetical protein